LLLGYYNPDGRLIYAGRAGTGMDNAELERLWQRLQPLTTDKMPLDVPPPRSTRFGSPLVLSRVHWVRPELVAEVKFLTWTDDNPLRQVVYGAARGQAGARGATGGAGSSIWRVKSLNRFCPGWKLNCSRGCRGEDGALVMIQRQHGLSLKEPPDFPVQRLFDECRLG
jgi:hypothetical protein